MNDGIVTWTVTRIQLINALRDQYPGGKLAYLASMADRMLDATATP